MTTNERGAAIQRAETAMSHLHEHQSASRNQLGAARDQLNIVKHWGDNAAMWDAVYAIESIVLDVYGAAPHQEG